MSFDQYIQTIHDQEQVNELQKIKEFENFVEIDKQNLEYISLISRAIERPIEIFIHSDLYYTVGSEFLGNGDAIQIEKVLTFQGPKWKKLKSNSFKVFINIGLFITNSIYYAISEGKKEKDLRELMVKVAKQEEFENKARYEL